MPQEYETLPNYAQRMGLKYNTVWKHYKEGKIPGAFKHQGSVLVPLPEKETITTPGNRAVTYARVSSSENKDNCSTQSERLYDYSVHSGYQVVQQVQEYASGLNENRPKLWKILNNPESWDVLVVEHKDRLTRFGYSYIEKIVQLQDNKIIIVNTTDDKENDLLEDLVSIITSFTARIYGQHRSKRKTEKIIAELEQGDSSGK